MGLERNAFKGGIERIASSRTFIMTVVIFTLVLLMIAHLAIVHKAHAEEVKTTVVFRNDFVNPESGDSFIKQWTTIQWNSGAFTAGTDIFTKTKYDYSGVRPYVAVNIYDKFDVMAGYQTDSKGADYALAGFWYYPSIAKMKIFVDAREYTAMSRTAKDFMEIYLGLTYLVTEKNSIGLDMCYDRYWEDKADEYSVGINLSHRLSSNLSVFIRPLKDWYAPKTDASKVIDSVRVGAKFSF